MEVRFSTRHKHCLGTLQVYVYIMYETVRFLMGSKRIINDLKTYFEVVYYFYNRRLYYSTVLTVLTWHVTSITFLGDQIQIGIL